MISLLGFILFSLVQVTPLVLQLAPELPKWSKWPIRDFPRKFCRFVKLLEILTIPCKIYEFKFVISFWYHKLSSAHFWSKVFKIPVLINPRTIKIPNSLLNNSEPDKSRNENSVDANIFKFQSVKVQMSIYNATVIEVVTGSSILSRSPRLSNDYPILDTSWTSRNQTTDRFLQH